MTSTWFFLSTLNYDARSTTHQVLSKFMSHDKIKPLTTSGLLLSDIILVTQKRTAPVLSKTTGEKVSHKRDAVIVRTIVVL